MLSLIFSFVRDVYVFGRQIEKYIKLKEGEKGKVFLNMISYYNDWERSGC